jgi:hypothetical protein
MKLANQIVRLTKANKANKLLAVIVILAVVAIGIDLITTHASTPFSQAVASSGSLGGAASIASDTNASGGKYVQFNSGSTSGVPGGVPIPSGDQVGWKQVVAINFNDYKNMPLGTFSGCKYGSGNNFSNPDSCSGLSQWPALQKALYDVPDGVYDTNHNGNCQYWPSQTLSDTTGVLNMFIHTSSSGQCETADPGILIPNGNTNDGGQLYGQYSVRMMVDSNDLECYKTAFLLWPDNTSPSWPAGGEIDYPEGNFGTGCGYGNGIQMNIHWAGSGSTSQYHCSGNNCSESNNGTGYTYAQFNNQWHTYTIQWTPGNINVLIDGNVVNSCNKSNGCTVPSNSMHYLLQTEAITAPNTSESGNMQIAWVTAYSYDPTCTSVPCP